MFSFIPLSHVFLHITLTKTNNKNGEPTYQTLTQLHQELKTPFPMVGLYGWLRMTLVSFLLMLYALVYLSYHQSTQAFFVVPAPNLVTGPQRGTATKQAYEDAAHIHHE